MSTIAAGEPPDFEELRDRIVRAIRAVCPAWLSSDADDLAQLAMDRLMKQQRSGRAEFSSGYLYRTAYSVVIDEIRRRRRHREDPIEEDLPATSPLNDPEGHVWGREVRELVASCLSALAVDRRRAVTLHLLGHSLAEITALLECARKRAENLVYRGLADLRACLTTHGVTT